MSGLVGRLRSLWRRRRGYAGADEPAADLPPLPTNVGERFSLVTSAYDTKPEFLRALAASIAAQNQPGAEWLLVDNGSTAPATRACLQQLDGRHGCRVVRIESNRGILGGMRAGLEAATREFVVPVDSDDLLAPYAIRALGHALAGAPAAKFLFSDEDHYTDGQRVNPFYRTGWDPALALACSYIWHLCAFDRRAALRLGVYADPGANYCHDWDTLLRFVRAGHEPVHVPAVLYSWRTHRSSTTNNDSEADAGSLKSQRHVLDLHLREIGLADRFVVADCPLWRGAPELRLERKPEDLPEIDLILHCSAGEAPRDAGDRITAELVSQVQIRRCVVLGDRDDCSVLHELGREPAFGVLIRDLAATVREPDAVGELVGWLELLPEVALVGARLVDQADRVVSAGYYPTPRGDLAAPDAGRRHDDPGYLAMALKPRTVAAIPPGVAMARGSWLAQLVGSLSEAGVAAGELVGHLSAAAAGSGMRTVCTPFVTASARHRIGAADCGVSRCPPRSSRSFSARGVWHGAYGVLS